VVSFTIYQYINCTNQTDKIDNTPTTTDKQYEKQITSLKSTISLLRLQNEGLSVSLRNLRGDLSYIFSTLKLTGSEVPEKEVDRFVEYLKNAISKTDVDALQAVVSQVDQQQQQQQRPMMAMMSRNNSGSIRQ
jgi:hypothetical protein